MDQVSSRRARFSVLIKDQTFVPQKIIIDQLGSCKSALKEIPVFEKVKHVFVRSEVRYQSHRTGSRTCPRETTRFSRVAIPAGSTRGDLAVSGFHEECVQEAAGIGGRSWSGVAGSVSGLG
jgi:hypothetical protein